MKGDPDAAIADYDQAIALNPQVAMAYYHRGVAHARIGEQGKAIADLERDLTSWHSAEAMG